MPKGTILDGENIKKLSFLIILDHPTAHTKLNINITSGIQLYGVINNNIFKILLTHSMNTSFKFLHKSNCALKLSGLSRRNLHAR